MSTRPRSPMALSGIDTGPPDAAILVVESNVAVGRELVEQLCADRYPSVHGRTSEHARVLARARAVRAVVIGELDAPRGALDLLEEIRRPRVSWVSGQSPSHGWEEGLPVIMLSPGATQLDLLRAFETGADDFIIHPPPYLELRARLRALLRRAESTVPRRMLRVGSLEIDIQAHCVRFAGAPVELCRLEYELLVYLARAPAKVCSKQELLWAIWGQKPKPGARTVDSHASRLRRKLDSAGASGFVVNVWGVGYRLL